MERELKMVAMKPLRHGLFAIAAFGLVAATPVFAEDISPAHLAASRQAVDAIDATKQFDSILLNAATQIKSELIVDNPNLQSQISDMVDETALSLASRRADLENEVARIYAKLFTEQELREIATFYTSEAGKKLLAQGPAATKETLQAADVWSNGILRDLRKQAQDKMKSLVASAGGKAGTPTPTAKK